MEAFLSLHQIQKTYQMGDNLVHALDGVSLNVYRGDFLAIVGTSGSGKSTLMNILGCLDFPDEGSYRLDQVDVTTLNDRELSKIRNEKVGFIFQSFNLIPTLNALENVELQLLYRAVDRKERRQLARTALTQVGLQTRMHHTPSQMSGGQQQRVAIARAIAACPSLILADEPTGNLDSSSAQEVIQILKRLNKQGKTIILITHDPAIAAQAGRVAHIADGHLLAVEEIA